MQRLYRELKIENYAYLREPSINQWLRGHLIECALAALIVLGLAFHSWRVGYLVRKRTAELQSSIALEHEAKARVEELRARMERMQKATIVGQLSNLIAHELAQPIAAIQYYAEGLKDLIAQDSSDPKLLSRCREGISAGLERTKEIISRVRGYSKNKTKRDQAIGLLDVVERLYATFSPETTGGVRFSMEGLYGVTVRGDALEMELLFNNLLKNAFEAASPKLSAEPRPFVKVYGGSDPERPGMTLVVVENTGRQLSAEEFADLATPLITSKTAGQGLGVPIAIAIAEASGGHLSFELRPRGGVIARIALPVA